MQFGTQLVGKKGTCSPPIKVRRIWVFTQGGGGVQKKHILSVMGTKGFMLQYHCALFTVKFE